MKEKRTLLFIIVCIVSLVGSWTLLIDVNVFTYVDWEFLLRFIELILGAITFGMCFCLGMDIYKNKIKDKIFNKDGSSKNNKNAA